MPDFFDTFFDTYGLYGHLDQLYENMVSRLGAKIGAFMKRYGDVSIEVRRCTLSIEECILTRSNYMLEFYANLGELKVSVLKIPQFYQGYFVIQGVEKCIPMLDLLHPSAIIVIDPISSAFKEATKVCEIRWVTDVYKSITVSYYEEKQELLVNINTFHLKDCNRSGESESLNPLFLLGSLIDDYTPEEVFNSIMSNVKHVDIANKLLSKYNRSVMSKENISEFQKVFKENYTNGFLKKKISDFLKDDMTLLQLVKTVEVMITHLINYIGKPSLYDNLDELTCKRLDYHAKMIETKFDAWMKGCHQHSNISSFQRAGKKFEESLIETIQAGTLQSISSRKPTSNIQTLSRKSYLDRLSHTRRIRVPFEVTSKNPSIRQVRGSQLGFICPFETPESKEVGLTKYLALTALVTESIPKKALKKIYDLISKEGPYPVLINNIYWGRGDENLLLTLKNLKADPTYQFCSFSIVKRTLLIYTDGGRIVRPVQRIFPDGKIVEEFIDCYEQIADNTLFYFETPEQLNLDSINYLEYSGLVQYGLSAAVAPLSNHSQTTRIAYQASISKQAITCDPEMLQDLIDGSTYLWYGQKDLLSTTLGRYLTQDRTTGVNCIVAIMAVGDNQEDAILMNKDAVDRGLFISTKIRFQRRTLQTGSECLLHGEVNDNFPRDENGIILPGISIPEKTHLFSIYRLSPLGPPLIERVQSVSSGTIAKVLMQHHIKEGFPHQSVGVVTHNTNKPISGDKFASRYSQKGVISRLVPWWDLPYTKEGVVPDIVMNLHAIPSRMTIGHLLEMHLSKQGLALNSFTEGTPFTPLNVEAFEKTPMFDPLSGEPIHNPIFMGVCFYQALKHQVVDKYQSRSTGPVSALSRQPVEGRANKGGLRIGEMEKDALVAYSAYNLLEERFLTESDRFISYRCPHCGTLFNEAFRCYNCGGVDLTSIETPYAFKLTVQTLLSANIEVREAF